MLIELIKDRCQKITDYLENINKYEINKNRQLFCDKVSIQSEKDFLYECFKQESPDNKKVALAVRKAIAKLGLVDVDYIRSDSLFGDLALLPIWEIDIFQTQLLVNAIESELGVHFTDKQLELAEIRNPDLNPDMKIHEFINEFYNWYSSQATMYK
jgi:hypothetical protein